MQWKMLSLGLLPALVLSACGRAEPGEPTHDAPRPVAGVEAPAAPGPAVTAPDAPAVAGEFGAEAPSSGAVGMGEAPAPARDGAVQPAQPAAPGAAAPSAPAAEQQRPAATTADEILRRVDRTYTGVRSMEADFVQHLSVPLLRTTQRSEGKLYQRRPDRFLMRFTDPAGDILVADGRHFWMYNPSVDRTQVIRGRLAEGSSQVDLQQQFLSNPTERFAATLNGTETLQGRPTHVLTLVPRGASQYKQIRIWVDQQDNLVRRFEMTEENESVRRIELSNLRLNVNLPDSLFQFTPPAGTQIFDR
jgi:outer membrane lipoprotein carrier protein